MVIKPLLAVNIGDLPLRPGRTVAGTFPTIGSLLTILIKNSLTIIGVLLIVLLIVGGIMFIIGAGSSDSKKSAEAKKMITGSLIGFAVVFLAFLIIQIIEVITGLSILNNPTL